MNELNCVDKFRLSNAEKGRQLARMRGRNFFIDYHSERCDNHSNGIFCAGVRQWRFGLFVPLVALTLLPTIRALVPKLIATVAARKFAYQRQLSKRPNCVRQSRNYRFNMRCRLSENNYKNVITTTTGRDGVDAGGNSSARIVDALKRLTAYHKCRQPVGS